MVSMDICKLPLEQSLSLMLKVWFPGKVSFPDASSQCQFFPRDPLPAQLIQSANTSPHGPPPAALAIPKCQLEFKIEFSQHSYCLDPEWLL